MSEAIKDMCEQIANALRDKDAQIQRERALAFVDREKQTFSRYAELFPNYEWADSETAIDLMAAEIKCLRSRAARKPKTGCTCGNPGVDLMTSVCDCVTPAEQSPCLCHFHVRFSSSGQTDSAEQPIRCGTFSETDIPDRGLQYALARVAERRAKQDAKHGGPAHDDTHSRSEWLIFLEDYVRRARYCENGETYEYFLIDVAALAVAAIQSSRRKHRDSERDNPENADPRGCA